MKLVCHSFLLKGIHTKLGRVIAQKWHLSDIGGELRFVVHHRMKIISTGKVAIGQRETGIKYQEQTQR